MTTASNFIFIDDLVLRENLDVTFAHLLDLVSLADSPEYNSVSRSSFRKTVIIYTASIIEALLLWLLRENVSADKLIREIIKFKISKEIYKINNTERIVLGSDVVSSEQIKLSKLNLADINSLCREHGIINDRIYKDVDRTRVLRNRLHIGTMSAVESQYSVKDLEFIFSIAKEIKGLGSH
jgi:hypothetical protein